MKLSEKYFFSDFTLINYKKLLTKALQNYSFCSFTGKKIKKSILLRHDVEFSIPIALKMAEIEKELGISSTYFFQLHSEFYNMFEKESILSLKKIMHLGHEIGLHFDSHYWNTETEEQLEEHILIEKHTLELYSGATMKVFSFHNNTSFTLSCRKETYGELLNVYSSYFRNNYWYNADSLGYWRYERLEDILNEAKIENLQILIHDGMWQSEILSPRQRIIKVIEDRAKYLKKLYDEGLKKFGVKNIDTRKILE